VPLVVVTSRDRDIPRMVRHVLRVGGEKVASQGLRGTGRLHRPTRAGDLPARFLVDPPAALEPVGRHARKRRGQLIVDLRNVTVRLAGTTVLDRVSWRVREGESWALTGPNGSGKTTLLGTIVCDHPQAYANDVRVFGRRRGDGQSIWEIRDQIGHVSPEIQALFPGDLTVEAAILSGFFDGPGAVGSGSPAQREAVRQWETALGLAEAAQRPFASLSGGQKRLVLLARAMVKRPRLLVLDEPCQGLDEEHRALIIAAIEVMTGSRETSLVYVTHDPRELPACIRHHLTMCRGRARLRPVWRTARPLEA
jgi:molybdate transport system ATP-binding protein